jgi:hypothetical protein
VRDGLKLSKLRAEHPTLTLIELIYVKKKHEKLTLACKGDTLQTSIAISWIRAPPGKVSCYRPCSIQRESRKFAPLVAPEARERERPKFGTSSLMSHRGSNAKIGEDRCEGADWQGDEIFVNSIFFFLFLVTAHRANGSADFYV